MAACAPGLPTLPALAPAASTPTLVPLSSATAGFTNTPVLAVTDTPTVTFTPIPSLTPTGTSAGALTASPLATGSPAASTTPVGTATVFEPISIDKLPRDTVYKRVRIDNVAHAQMDISLHCTTRQGLHTILEYDNVKHLTIEAPDGDYVYVVYVGGRKIVGGFSLLHATSAYITVYKDHVTVR